MLGGVPERDGRPTSPPWDEGSQANAAARLGRDWSGRIYTRYEAEDQRVEVIAERVSDTAFTNEHKPKACLFGR